MKRLLIIVLLVWAVIVGWLVLSPAPNAPQFKAVGAAQLPSYQTLYYNFLQERPFNGGKMWLSLFDGTNYAWYLYDIEQRKMLGELRGGWPAFSDNDHSQVFCATAEKHTPVVDRIFRLFTSGAVRTENIETFWLLDLRRNSVKRLGEMRHSAGASSFAKPSPDFRFAFSQIMPPPQKGPNMYLFDLERKSSRSVKIDGWTPGWWDDERLLFQDGTNDFYLCHVPSGRISPLLQRANILAFLNRHGIDHKGALTMFSSWNGNENVFYVTDGYQKWLAADSVLIRVERPDARLTLLSPNFKFEWSDHFDHSQRYYLYSGRETNQGSDGVFLRDLRTQTETTLVAPNGERYFSVPNFYGDKVIYVRRRKELWQTDLTGSNQIRLFPPVKAGTE